MAGSGGDEQASLEFTPTWMVVVVGSVIVFVSLVVERLLHALGKYLIKRNRRPLFEALQKVKEELMLLGFISLLLMLLQNSIVKICVPEYITRQMLPCKREDHASVSTSHYQIDFFSGISGSGRRLLSGGSGANKCPEGKVPFLSLEAVHRLHIFIFVLAVSHVLYCTVTMLLGMARIREWRNWEDAIHAQQEGNNQTAPRISHVRQFEFIQERFKGFGKNSKFMSWVHSFLKQFYGSITKSDYTTLRLGFIMTHCKGNPRFNFHKYMIRILESDFKKIVGISWYLWVFVMVFFLILIDGWHTYIWIGFIPLILLLAVGTKLEHVITQLAHEVAEKHCAIEGDLVVTPSDNHFWFHKPRAVLYLIQFILFQNSFEIAFFFWILVTYGFNSCIMAQLSFIIPRLVIGVLIQILTSYSTLPLYALVTQMGSSLKKEIFDEHLQEGLKGWTKKIKKQRAIGQTSKAKVATNVELQDVGMNQSSRVEDGSPGPSQAQQQELHECHDEKPDNF
ncbi:MLO-like protein 1 isoform X1 [Wolffia australiana]